MSDFIDSLQAQIDRLQEDLEEREALLGRYAVALRQAMNSRRDAQEIGELTDEEWADITRALATPNTVQDNPKEDPK